MSTGTRPHVICHVCKRAIYTYLDQKDASDSHGRRRQPWRMIRHTKPDVPVVAFFKRLWPWTTEPLCEGSDQLVRPVRWS